MFGEGACAAPAFSGEDYWLAPSGSARDQGRFGGNLTPDAACLVGCCDWSNASSQEEHKLRHGGLEGAMQTTRYRLGISDALLLGRRRGPNRLEGAGEGPGRHMEAGQAMSGEP